MIPAGVDLWAITIEDKSKYDAQFLELQPSGGYLSGEQAKNFFIKSNLTPAVLAQIWGLADLTADGRMDRKEFSIAMLLIKRKLQGYELPRALPRSLLAEPHGGGGGFAAGAAAMVAPGAVGRGLAVVQPQPPVATVQLPVGGTGRYMAAVGTQPAATGLVHASPARVRSESTGSDWAVSAAKKLNYMQVFNREDRMHSGYLSGYEGGRVLAETGLPNPTLAKIWELSDIDGDGKLTAEEFCVAMHLAETALAGAPLPMILPPDLVPPQFRRRLTVSGTTGAAAGGSSLRPGAVALPGLADGLSALGELAASAMEEAAAAQPMTAEDKRRENFARGNQELERRRQELQAQQRREEEERQALERAEAERREQARLEQERKKQQELERQVERQRQLEAEREEKRRQAMEAREAARREVERQRQRDWERGRKEQVLADRKRHEETVESLRAVVSDLKFELETLESKKTEHVQRIGEAKQAVVNSSLSIEAMRHDRDNKLADIDMASRLQVEHEEKFRQLCIDYDRFNTTLQSQIDSRPLPDTLKALQSTHSSKKTLVEGLRSRLEAVGEENRSCGITLELHNSELHDVRNTIGRLVAAIAGRRTDIQRACDAWIAEKQRRKREEAEKQAAWEEEQRKIAAAAEKARRDAAAAAAAAEKARQEAAAEKARQEAAAEKARQEAAAEKARQEAAAEKARQDAMAAAEKARQEAAAEKARQEAAAEKARQGAIQGDGASKKKPLVDGKDHGQAEQKTLVQSSDMSNAWPSTGEQTPPSALDANGWDAFPSPATEQPVTGKDAFGKLAWPTVQPTAAQTASVTPSNSKTPRSTLPRAPLAQSAHAAAPAPITAAVQAAPKSSGSQQAAVRYKALYDFAARNADELSLVADDVITVRPEDQVDAEEGWMFGIRGAEKGWFPSNYVERSAEPGAALAPATPASTANGVQLQPTLRPSDQTTGPLPGARPDKVSGSIKMVARYNWEAKKDNHLSFSKGDIINVKEQQGGMWLGELRGAEGLFPKDYVVPLSRDETAPDARAIPTSSAKEGAELAIAIYAYTSEEAGDLTFQLGDVITVTSKEGEWWTGTLDGRAGIFPANYVKNVEGKSVTPRLVSQTATGQPTKEIGMVIAAYEASGPGQLSLLPNQLIQVRKKSESGWWEGELQVRGQPKQVGWFPKDYIKLLSGNAAAGGGVASSSGGGLLGSPAPSSTPEPKREGSSPGSGDAQLGTPSRSRPLAQDSNLTQDTKSQEPERVIARYPYTANQEDELSFERDAIITVLDKEESDWWRGTCEGRTGMFPANYVQPYTSKTMSPSLTSTAVIPSAIDGSQLTDVEKQRQLLIKELMQTEETYVADMIAVAEVFFEPLLENRLLSKADLDAIFINWKELIHSNRKLVKAMKVRSRTCGAGNPVIVIGDILAESLPTMTAYIRYCSQQLNAATVLQKRCESDAAVKDFLAKCAQSTRIRGMPLSSYLLKPMQRITRYPLLIDKIKSCTPSEHPDHAYITEALQKAEELANQVNEGVRQTDNSDKLEWIQNHVLCDGMPEKLTFNSLTNSLGPRKLIYSGALQKVRSGKDLYVFLFNDFLLLTQAATSGASSTKAFNIEAKGTVFKMYKTPIFLNELAVKPLPAPDKSESEACTFQMSWGEVGTELKAATATERDAWVKRLQLHSEAYLDTEKKKRERTNSLMQHQLSKGIGRILVIVMEGCNLVPKADTGGSDPYCEVSMGCTMQKTKVVPGNLNPKWNSSMQFPVKSVHDDVLCLTVFDQDRFSPNDFLGRTEIRVADIMRESKEKRGPLLKRLPLQEVASGEVVIKLDLQLYGGAEKQAVAS